MLDIGANVGRTAVPRVVLGDVSAVYCAEPDAENYYCLRRNVESNGLAGLVMPDRVAITDRTGTVLLQRAPKHTGHRVATAAAPAGDVVQVPGCTLDDWIGRHGIDLEAVTFIKVDVEGHEERVLAGAAGALARPHIAWQLEVWARQLAAAGGSAEGMARLLAPRFTHYIDMRRDLPGARVCPITQLRAAMAALDADDGKTDLIVFNA